MTITLQGTEGESEPHHLTDPEKPVFERGGVDMFLLTTHFSLGDLRSIRLWHDNSGAHSAWYEVQCLSGEIQAKPESAIVLHKIFDFTCRYVNKVMVQDLDSGQKWHFLCNSWLAVDVGECTLDKVFPVATEVDLKRFRSLEFYQVKTDDKRVFIEFVSCLLNFPLMYLFLPPVICSS